MSNLNNEHPSIRVHAPPGGQSSNIFGTSEFEQSAANKKKHMGSDIFGHNKDTQEVTSHKPVRQAGNNIFGTDPEPVATKSHMHGDKNKSTVFDAPAPAAAPAPTPAPAPAPAPAATATAKPAPTEDKSPSTGTLAGQYKQNQMKSSIFGNDEPAASRPISDKNRSNIFGAVEQDQHQGAGGRQGKRDPNASRMGYNPINGEAYAPKETSAVNNDKPAEQSHENAQVTTGASSENANPQPAAEKAGNGQDQANNANNAQKNVHTSVRVFHPPGGRSNGPLW